MDDPSAAAAEPAPVVNDGVKPGGSSGGGGGGKDSESGASKRDVGDSSGSGNGSGKESGENQDADNIHSNNGGGGGDSAGNIDAAAAATATNANTDTVITTAATGETAAAAAAGDATAGAPISNPLDEGGCFVCKRNDKQALILLCDGCDGEYHTFCVDPPLRKIPDDEWFCHECKAAGKGGPKNSKYTGVYWSGTTRVGGMRKTVWTAKIRRRSGRSEAIIGSYHSEKEAAGAYDAEAKRVFGDAHPALNFPNGSWKDEPDEPELPQSPPKPKPHKPKPPTKRPQQQPAAALPPVASSPGRNAGVPAQPVPNARIQEASGSRPPARPSTDSSDAVWVDISDAGGQGTSTSSLLPGASRMGIDYVDPLAPVVANAAAGGGVGTSQRATSERASVVSSQAALPPPSGVRSTGTVVGPPAAGPTNGAGYGVGVSSRGGSGTGDANGGGGRGAAPGMFGLAPSAPPSSAVTSVPVAAPIAVTGTGAVGREPGMGGETAGLPSSTRKHKGKQPNSAQDLQTGTHAEMAAGAHRRASPPPAKKRTPWGGKDWGGQPLSQAVKDELLGDLTLWSVSADGTLVGEDGNHFFCSACGESGDLTCCDECPRVFHEDCLPLGTDSQLAAQHQTEDDPWYCPSCAVAGRVNLIAGKVPNWTPEDRALMRKREKKREKKAHKARSKPSLGKAGKSGERQQRPSPATSTPGTRDLKTRCKNPKRAAAAATAEGEAVTAAKGLVEVPLEAVNVSHASDLPHQVTRLKAFDPLLDNVLLRSLLYEEEYTHVLSKPAAPKKTRWRPKPVPSPRSTTAAGGALEGWEDATGPTTGTHLGESGSAAAAAAAGAGDADDRKATRPFTEQRLGALTEHLPLSPRAGQRPKHYAYCDKRRLGPPFAGSVGPGRVIDGTAVGFGARATGPFRAGLAATMVEVGLVPDDVVAEVGYSELVRAEAALAGEAEKAARE
ncbi:unnamed protein product, partial [Scytosiphon promiscuus]